MDDLGRIREFLAACRANGLPFDQAWSRAVMQMPKADRALVQDTVDSWRGAYLGLEQPKRERAAGALARYRDLYLPAGEVVDDDAIPRCDWCGEPIGAAQLRRHAVFCSASCQKANSKARERFKTAA